MREPPRLVTDAYDRRKIKVSLPGGRYQLSLDDRAVNLVEETLDLEERDVVNVDIVRSFIATGDAWFPQEKDTDAILSSIADGGSLTENERDAIQSYLTSHSFPERHKATVRRICEETQVGQLVEPEEVTFTSLPLLDQVDDLLGKQPEEDSAPESKAGETTTLETPVMMEELMSIPGVGPQRAEILVEGGVKSLSALAETTPTELVKIQGISGEMAMVVIEGARDALGKKPQMHKQLAAQTGQEASFFEGVIAQLAAAGVPGSTAAPVLRTLFGDTVADLDPINPMQAYFLWEAGYRTQYDLEQASDEELLEVEYIGTSTLESIRGLEATSEGIGEF